MPRFSTPSSIAVLLASAMRLAVIRVFDSQRVALLAPSKQDTLTSPEETEHLSDGHMYLRSSTAVSASMRLRNICYK